MINNNMFLSDAAEGIFTSAAVYLAGLALPFIT
jgi:hypothetical protein